MWFIFIWLVDYCQMLADMTHYASGPALADERIEFQEAGSICYPAVHTLQTILAYPLNFVYLTTGYSKEL